MQAVVKAKAEPGLWLEKVPVPDVAGDDVLIRVLKTSICGTDVHIYNWDAWAQKTIPVPMTIGHELVGEDVLITGAGPIGCMAIPICEHAGARHVVITDVNPYRLELAWKMGVDLALNVRTQKLTDAMKKLGMKEGFDVALEMSGNPKAFDDILPNMFHGGKIALLGIMPGSAAIDWNTVVFDQLTIKGIYGRELYETWYKMTALIKSGVDITPIITHRFPYTQFKEAIELMKSGNSGKIILNWSER